MRNLILFLVIIAIPACTKKEFCIEPNNVFMTMDFKTYDSTNALVDTLLVNASVYNTDTSYLFADNVASLNSVNVVLNQKIAQQKYIIHQTTTRDTIIVIYSSEEKFISNGCGYQTYFELKKVSYSRHSIDSVNIANAAVNPNPQTAHLEVIYK